MIRAENLTKDYDGGLVKALRGVSFAAAPGEAVALMGPSGCGKTTLLSILSSLEPPSSGEVRIAGKPLDSYRPFAAFRADWVGFIFQFHHLLPHLTLLENVMLPMDPRLAKAARRDKAAGLLARVGLGEKLHARPTRVSGGERQRGAIARALARDPKMLFADEPTGSVDTDTGREIMEFVVHTSRAAGVTLVIATHNPDVAALADRIVRMKNGLIEGGTGGAQ